MSEQESIGYWDHSDKPKSTGYRDPFYNLTHSVAGVTQPMPYAQVPLTQHLNEPSLQAVREIVRVEVRKALVEIITEIRAQTGARF